MEVKHSVPGTQEELREVGLSDELIFFMQEVFQSPLIAFTHAKKSISSTL